MFLFIRGGHGVVVVWQEKGAQRQTFGSAYLPVVGCLPREGLGVQKVWYVARNPGKTNFFSGTTWDIAGISWGTHFLGFSDFFLTFSGSGVGGSQTPLGRLFGDFSSFGVLGSVHGGGDVKSSSHFGSNMTQLKYSSVAAQG